MKCLVTLAAVALIFAPTALWAAPDDAPEKTVATTQDSVSLSMTTMGSGADRKVRIQIGGDWDSLAESARRSVLGSLKTMLPEETLKTVLKRIVAGEKVIEVPAPEAKPRAALEDEVIEIEQCGPMIEIEDEDVVEDPVIRDGGLVLRGKIVTPKSAAKGGGCGGGCGGGEAEKPAGCKGDGSCGACTGEDKTASAWVTLVPQAPDRLLRINGREVRDRDLLIKMLKQGELIDEDGDDLQERIREAVEALKEVRALQGDVKGEIEGVERARKQLEALPLLKLNRDGREIEVETEIRVIGPDGEPIPHGKDGIVILKRGGKSDAAGRFHIEGMKPGPHQIRVRSMGNAAGWNGLSPKVKSDVLAQLKRSLPPEQLKSLLRTLQSGGPGVTWVGEGRGPQVLYSDGKVMFLGGCPTCGNVQKPQGPCGCGGQGAKAPGRCGCGGQGAKAPGRCGCGGQGAKAPGRCGCGGQGAKAPGRCGCGGQGAKAPGRCGCGGQGAKAPGRCGCGGQGAKAPGRCGCGGQGAKAPGRCGCGGQGAKPQGPCGCGGQGAKAPGRCGCGGQGAKAQGPCGCGGQAPKAPGRCGCGGKGPAQGPDAVIRAMEALRREMEALRREIRGAHGMHGGMKPPSAPPPTGFWAPAPPKVPAIKAQRARIATAPAASKSGFRVAMPKGGAASGTSFYTLKPAKAGNLEVQVAQLKAEITKQNAMIQHLLARLAKLEATIAK